MSGLRQYILTVIASAFVCALLASLIERCSAKRIIKSLLGLVMGVTIFMPLKQDIFRNFSDIMDTYTDLSGVWVDEGAEMARTAKEQFIKSEVEAYILDKAQAVNADVSVELDLNDALIPVSVTLWGKASPYAKNRLTEMLQTDLGITKERQIWTG